MSTPEPTPTEAELANEITTTLLRVINRVGRNKARSFGSGAPMTLVEAEMCNLISQRDAITSSEISKHLAVTRSATSQVITRLKAKGYVTETHDPQDAKRKWLHVTELGEEVSVTAMKYFEVMTRDLYGTSLDELESWLRFVQKLEAFQSRLSEPGLIDPDQSEPSAD